jgi:glycosyltransferase involved in cell wall biosynthesis
MSTASAPISSAPPEGRGDRLHILILSDRDWTHPQGGGTGTNLFNQVARWIAWGHRVSVIASSHPGAGACERLGPLTLYRVGSRSTVFPRVIARQWRRFVPDADVVLEVINGITFLTPVWCRTPRVTLVHHIHRDHYAQELGNPGRVAALMLETLPLRLLYRNSQFLTISRATVRDIARHGIDPTQIEISYPGVELQAFGPDPSVRAKEPTLLYLGRLKRYKRIEVVLDVLQRIPEATLDIAGDGDHREALVAETAARGLAARVRMHGHVSEDFKRELYRRAWVNVTASSAEGWGLSVTEAAACGTPSAALRLGGLPEAIDEGRTGVLADNPEELAGVVSQLIAEPRRRDELGAQALIRAAEFSWDATARRTLTVLDGQRRRALPDALPAAGLISPEPVVESAALELPQRDAMPA